MAGSAAAGGGGAVKKWANGFQTRVGNPLVRALLRSRFHGSVSETMLDLEYTGRRSGRRIRLPVLYARQGRSLVVVVGWAEVKTWWRNFGSAPQRVTVLLQGRRLSGEAVRLTADSDDYAAALTAYKARHPKMEISEGAPVLAVTVLAPE